MVKIPSFEDQPSVGVDPAHMPGLAGDGWTAPGRATQQLGHSVMEVGSAVGSLQTMAKQQTDYEDKLKMLQFSNQVDLDGIESKNKYDGDGSDYLGRQQSYYDGQSRKLLDSVVDKRKAQIFLETKKGSVLEDASRFAYKKRNETLLSSTDAGITSQFGILAKEAETDGTDPETFATKLGVTIQGVNAIIDKYPLDEAHKEKLRDKAATLADSLIKSYFDPERNPKRASDGTSRLMVEKIIRSMQERATPPPGSQVGPRSDAGDYGPVKVAPTGGGHSIVTSGSGARFRVAGDYADRFAGLVSDLEAEGLSIKGEQSGGYAYRTIAGTSKLSRHASGEAIDVNWDENPRDGRMGAIVKQVPPERIRAIAAANGLKWGGDWRNPDPMHFEVDRQGTVAARSTGSRVAQGDVGAPAGTPPETIAAAKTVAAGIGADPRAVGAVIAMESGWDKSTRTGAYAGMTQVGRKTLEEMGVNPRDYAKMSQAEQTAFYGKWLEHYGFSDKLQAAGVDFKSLPPQRQAAVLQAFQFAPNGNWLSKLASGDTQTPVTETRQAKALGSTSIADMERHFTQRMGLGAPVGKEGVATTAAKDVPPVSERAFTRGAEKPDAAEGGKATQPGTIPTDAEVAAAPDPNAPTKVADASGGTIPGGKVPSPTWQPKQPPSGAPQGYMRPSVESAIAERLMKQLNVYAERDRKVVEGQIAAFDAGAAKGIAPPDAEIEKALTAAHAVGDPRLVERLAGVVAGAQVTAKLQKATPEEINASAIGLEAHIKKNGGTPMQVAQLAALQKMHKEIDGNLKADPLDWGAKAGIVLDTNLSPDHLTPEALAARADAARTVADHYGRPPVFFKPDERAMFKEVFAKGGRPLTEALGSMYTAFGQDMPHAMKELSKDAPEAATLGWMISNKSDQGAIKDLADGIALRTNEKFKSIAPPADKAYAAAIAVTGNALGSQPTGLHSAIDLANILYDKRAFGKSDKAGGAFDSVLWSRGFKEIIGQVNDPTTGKVYGGIASQGWFGSRPVWVPSTIEQGRLADVVGAIKLTDLAQGGTTLPDVTAPLAAGVKPVTAASAPTQAEPSGDNPLASMAEPPTPSKAEPATPRPAFGEGVIPESVVAGRVMADRAAIDNQQAAKHRLPVTPLSTITAAPLANVVSKGLPMTDKGKPVSLGDFRRATLVSVGDGRYTMAMGDPASDDPQYLFNSDGSDFVLDLKKLEPTLRPRFGADSPFRP